MAANWHIDAQSSLVTSGMSAKLRIIQISFFLDPQGRAPEQLLRDWWSLVDIAEAAALAELDVTVIQACAKTQTVMHGDVTFEFVSPEVGTDISSSSSLAALLQRLRPDVVHVHGLGFPRQVMKLTKLLPGVPILLQDHADGVPRFWRRPMWRRGLAAAAGVSFCAAEQATPFQKVRLLEHHTRIFAIPESTSRFTPGDQLQARATTGISGDPCMLWVGNLDSNKDPLTVLSGVSAAAKQLTNLQLWCCFGSAPLLEAVQAKIQSDPLLVNRVHLLGNVSHAQIELLMRAADLFVLGSHREGSGYSVIEALACGLPPIITDIPSFRALTNNGAVGALWPCDDSAKLAESLLRMAESNRQHQRAETRRFFERELSFEALGRRFRAAYATIVAA